MLGYERRHPPGTWPISFDDRMHFSQWNVVSLSKLLSRVSGCRIMYCQANPPSKELILAGKRDRKKSPWAEGVNNVFSDRDIGYTLEIRIQCLYLGVDRARPI